jgi:thiamine-phosphate pyrophosphorylase
VSAFDPRLIVVTDRALAHPNSVCDVVAAALRGGARVIQLRDKNASARELFEQAMQLLPLVRNADALLFVNDRVDVAIAAGCDGVHLGPGDLPLDAARAISPAGFLIGFSTDDPATAQRAEQAGADYIGCGAVFGTTTKAEVGDERIGTGRLDEVARAVSIPVIGIGGIGLANVHEVAATSARGAAVVGAVMKAADPEDAARRLIAAFGPRPEIAGRP